MIKVQLNPGEMSRDVEGLRKSSVTFSSHKWVDVTTDELAKLKAMPHMRDRFITLHPPEPFKAVEPKPAAPVTKKAPSAPGKPS